MTLFNLTNTAQWQASLIHKNEFTISMRKVNRGILVCFFIIMLIMIFFFFISFRSNKRVLWSVYIWFIIILLFAVFVWGSAHDQPTHPSFAFITTTIWTFDSFFLCQFQFIFVQWLVYWPLLPPINGNDFDEVQKNNKCYHTIPMTKTTASNGLVQCVFININT